MSQHVVIIRVILFSVACTATSVCASTLISDTFEESLGNWSAQGGASLYAYKGSGINYATQGNGAAAVTSGWDEGVLTLKENLRLHSNQATSITISFDYEWDTTTATRLTYIDYSTDGGRTWSDDLGDISAWGSFAGIPTLGSFSKTLEEKTVGAFTDKFKFRIRGKDGNNPVIAHIDNIEIVGTNVIQINEVKDDIPETSALAFVLLAFTLAGLQRRKR
jgi:hypothetical protein